MTPRSQTRDLGHPPGQQSGRAIQRCHGLRRSARPGCPVRRLDSNGDVLADTWVWNGTDWTEEFFEDGPVVRFGAGMAFEDRSIVAAGGTQQERSKKMTIAT